MYTAESFKILGQITFAFDHLSVNNRMNSMSFKYNEIKDIQFIYNGIFGDTNSLSLETINQINTKDGSGNFLTFYKDGTKYTFNIVLEDLQDVRILKLVFANIKTEFNIDVNQ
jgi:hypothetical protein